VFAVWFGLQLIWKISTLFFVVFLATLFGLAVARGVTYLERFKIRRGVGSALIVFGTMTLIGGGLALSAPTLIVQGKELQREFPAALTKVQEWVDSRTGATGALINAAAGENKTTDSTRARNAGVRDSGVARPPSEVLKEKITDGMAGASSYLFSFLSSTVAVMGAIVLLVFLAIYIGAEPDVYRGWMLAAVPAALRPQMRQVLSEISTVLRKWLVTQLIAMIVIGSVCTVVLLVLGVKAPFALGFIAGLMEFVPTVGPVFSAVPAVLMGFVDSPEKALAVAIAYWGIQFLENNLLIPYLMRGEMDLPPAITLVAQTLMTLVFGLLGLMVAVPLTAAVLVPVRMLAERENAKERELALEQNRTADMRTPTATMRVTTEHAVAHADKGPLLDELDEARPDTPTPTSA
jgi:predicted PurR-regulated permease PerM